jgi:Tfp pilus assembly protein PilX
MRVTPGQTRWGRLRRAYRRLRAESGFTMIVALGTLTVTTLLIGAVFITVQGDASLTRANLNGKQAYAAAQSGLQAYLYQLNNNASNSSWWETCTNDTLAQTAVPGTTTGATYSYAPVAVAPYTSCNTANPVASLIDPSTGTLRMEFTGYSATGSGAAKRTIVASLRTLSPLSFLWYTVYETEDTSINNNGCGRFFYQSPGPDSSCVISWVTGDSMNGPMYTQDQFYVPSGNSPQFGRLNSNDAIASQDPSSLNSQEICASDNCANATVSNPEPDVATQVPLPSDNGSLSTDASHHGLVVTGTTTLTISGNTATGATCTTSSASSCTAINIASLSATPIVYANNGSSCSSSNYDPTNVNYTNTIGGTGTYKNDYYGSCGDIYVSGSYTSPLTIAAADDVIVTGNLTTTVDASGNPTGAATLGLVANQYVRVKHDCTGNPDVTIDGAILTLQHSFFVDNYDCGGTPLGHLNVYGAIAQYYRGIVGTVGASGYLKNYNYDDRLALILPPYLFDLQNTEWTVFRETLCSPTLAAGTAGSCS